VDPLLGTLAQEPWLWAVLVVSGLAVLGDAALILVAARRWRAAPEARCSWWPEAVVLLLWVGPPLLATTVERGALQHLLGALADPAPGAKAEGLAQALTVALNGRVVAVVLWPLHAMALALAAAGLGAGRLRGAPRPVVALASASVAGPILAQGVLAAAILVHLLELTRLLSAVAGAPAADQAVVLRDGLAAGAALEVGAAVAAALCLVALGAGAWAVARGRLMVAPGPALGFVAVALGLSGALHAELAPLAAENRRPIPFTQHGVVLSTEAPVALPAVVGPRPAERGALITVGPERLLIEGVDVGDVEGLVEKLGVLRTIERMMGGQRPLSCVLLGDASTPAGRMAAVAAVAARSCDGVRLGFVREGPADERPLLGRRMPRQESALGVAVGDGPGPTVTFTADERYDALAARSVAQAGPEGAVVWALASDR
jgi:hypothetical protein